MIDPKVLKFAMLGACGCLAAWILGEGWLMATHTTGPSLVSKPEAPTPPPTQPNRPPLPAIAKELPPPPKPLPLSGEWAKRLEGTGTGDVRFSLRWFNRNDLDLYCKDPNGFTIYFKKENRKSPSGGELDRDSNNGAKDSKWGDTDAPIENIAWPSGKAPVGEYSVWVHHHPNRSGAPTLFEVRTEVDGVEKEFKGDDYKVAKDEVKQIGTFHVKRELFLAVPAAVVVDQGGKNTLGIRIGRKRVKGDVRLEFVEVGKGLTLIEKTIGADETKADIEVTATEDAPSGKRKIEAIAVCDGIETRERFEVDVRRVPPSVQLSVPFAVEVDVGGSNKLPILVKRDRFRGPVKLTLAGAAQGLTLDPTTIADGQTEAEITLTADQGTDLGNRSFVVEVAGAANDEAKAAKGIDLTVRAATKPPPWWFEVLRIACWTGLLAAGLATALACGQNYYLERPLLGSGLGLIVAGSFAAGAVAGGLGQGLFAGLASAALEPMIGFVVGWLLLGALLGRGVGFFIPNLGGGKASLAGAIGGLAAGLSFLAISHVGGALPGRLLGSLLLGASIGAMVAIAERVFRKVWLEVRRGPNEAITVNLGPEPVQVGSGPGCTVFVAGALTALRYWIREGKVMCEATNEVAKEEPTGRARTFGSVTLTVHSANQTAAASPAPPKPLTPGGLPTPRGLPTPGGLPTPVDLPPAPVKPAPVASSRARDPDGCPKCGERAPGPKGLRFCPNCECKF